MGTGTYEMETTFDDGRPSIITHFRLHPDGHLEHLVAPPYHCHPDATERLMHRLRLRADA